MKTRNDINSEISEKKSQISKLNNLILELRKSKNKDSIKNIEKDIKKIKMEIIDLNRESLMFSDDKQWYSEEYMKIATKNNRIPSNKLVGCINWKEEHIDQNDGEVITIYRSKVVKIDNVWL